MKAYTFQLAFFHRDRWQLKVPESMQDNKMNRGRMNIKYHWHMVSADLWLRGSLRELASGTMLRVRFEWMTVSPLGRAPSFFGILGMSTGVLRPAAEERLL